LAVPFAVFAFGGQRKEASSVWELAYYWIFLPIDG